MSSVFEVAYFVHLLCNSMVDSISYFYPYIWLPLSELRQTVFVNSSTVDKYKDYHPYTVYIPILKEMYSEDFMKFERDIRIDNLEQFEKFSQMAEHFGLYALPDAVIQFIFSTKKLMSDAEYHKRKDRKELILRSWKGPSTSEEIRKIVDSDYHDEESENHYIKAATTWIRSISFIRFMFTFCREEILRHKKMEDFVNFIIENGNDDDDFYLFRDIIDKEVGEHYFGKPNPVDFPLYFSAFKTCVMKKRDKYIGLLIRRINEHQSEKLRRLIFNEWVKIDNELDEDDPIRKWMEEKEQKFFTIIY